MSVTGNALVGGMLDVSLINGFTPTPGQMFTVLTAGSVTYNGLALGGSAASSFYLLVGPSSVTLQAAGLPGDYNFDGVVDAADYVVWRKGPGICRCTTIFGGLISAIRAGVVRCCDESSVPEPTTALLLVCGLLPLLCRRELACATRERENARAVRGEFGAQ